MIFKPNQIKNIAIIGIILILPVFISMVLPNVDQRIIFGLPTIILVMFLIKWRSKLQYEIDNDHLVLVSRDGRKVIPIVEIKEIHLRHWLISPVTQYFVLHQDKEIEIAKDLVNEKGETVIDVLIKRYGIDVIKKGSVKMIVKK
ncbi:hypothetical protein [Fusibacter sp. 3D3]|uniref:hypothetical protein n=1 Tax=Fusibacter sp. 3D3 TaxID=1048380 RepID=UPI000853F076|nr:hypothetical protein [Fusibacter sp. 3D3]GAU78518.1 hypothetical protein F3D3_3152 [Fusibacter sp. 3D3]